MTEANAGNTGTTNTSRPTLSLAKVLLVVAIIVAVIALALVIKASMSPDSSTKGTNNSQTPAVRTQKGVQTGPDQVKESTGSTGDISPSGTGTGPGSDNSLLGQ